MTNDRLEKTFRLVANAINTGLPFERALAEVKARPRLDLSEVTEEDVAEVQTMTVGEIAQRLPPARLDIH
jgi:hypothetical protein